jgi:hypothetical protein
MTNMNDRNHVALNAIVDNVGIAAEPKRMNAEVPNKPGALW